MPSCKGAITAILNFETKKVPKIVLFDPYYYKHSFYFDLAGTTSPSIVSTMGKLLLANLIFTFFLKVPAATEL